MNDIYQYQKLRTKVYENYGTEHLCGNCKYMTKCIRNLIQISNDANQKGKLMRRYAPFVLNFAVEKYEEHHKQTGFVAVYDCTKFEFDGYEGAK
jgi:hypothetical protein